MCGIVGYIKLNTKNKHRFDPDLIATALVTTSTRGTEATGFFTPELGVIKDGVSADKFCADKADELKKAAQSNIFIGHCRAATTGFRGVGTSSPSDNNNNHPHEGKRFILVHNGHFSGLYQVKNYKYNGSCDSELALAYLDTFGIKRGIALMPKSDNFSLVFYDKTDGAVYFYRESNPLVFGFSYATGSLVFGSTSYITLCLHNEASVYGLQIAKDLSPMYSTEEHVLYRIMPDKDVETIKIELTQSRYDIEKRVLTEKEKDLLDIPPPYQYKGSEDTARSRATIIGGPRNIVRGVSMGKTRRLEVYVTIMDDGEVVFCSGKFSKSSLIASA